MEPNLFVMVTVSGQLFGIPVHQIKSVERWVPAAHAAADPAMEPTDAVSGLLNGTVPVFHLNKLLTESETSYGDEAFVLVVEVAGSPAGCVVDGVSAIQRLDNVMPVPVLLSKLREICLFGVAIYDDQPLVLLDLERLLALQGPT